MKILVPSLALSGTFLLGILGNFITASWGWRSRLPLGLCWCGGATFFPCGVWLNWSGYCLQVYIFCLSRLSLFLWLVGVGFCGLFFFFFLSFYVHWHFWVTNFFTSTSGIHEAKRNPGNSSLCCLLGPEVTNQSAFFTPPFQSHLIMFLFFVIFRSFSCISKRNGEKNISIFPKAEVSRFHILIFFDFLNFLTYNMRIIPSAWDHYQH